MQGEVFRQCRAPIQDEPPHVPTISSTCLPHPEYTYPKSYTDNGHDVYDPTMGFPDHSLLYHPHHELEEDAQPLHRIFQYMQNK